MEIPPEVREFFVPGTRKPNTMLTIARSHTGIPRLRRAGIYGGERAFLLWGGN